MIPVSIITGFLGSGKTTLLRRLLADPRMGQTAVLVNEFGEVGLDHILLRKIDEDIVLLNSGCLCCSIRDDLVETLDDLRAKRAAGEIPAFDQVVIETTGLADPAPIVHTLMTDASITPVYRLKCLAATIDATHGNRHLDQHLEAAKQAAMADRLVLTKTDVADRATVDSLRRRLAALAPTAAIFHATLNAGPGPDDLFGGDVFAAGGKSEEVRRWLNEEVANHRLHHHDVNRHDDRISTFCLTADAPLDWNIFTSWLSLLLASRGEQLLRIKGLLNVAGRDKPVVVHGVQHVFYPPTELPAWPDADHRSRLVFITRDLSRTAIEKSFQRVQEG